MAEYELQHVIYQTLLTQIQFGIYQYGDSLSAAYEVSERFHVSVDTVQSAYRRLKQEGYISLTRNAGARVIMSYDEAETEQHIQSYFSLRRDALLDLSRSIEPLFGYIQWIGLKHASPETLETIEQLSSEHAYQSYVMWKFFEQKYIALHNNILMRLARQVYLFFQAPFFIIDEDSNYLNRKPERVKEVLALCRRQKWADFQKWLSAYQNKMHASLQHFYAERIILPSPEAQIDFCWSSYKKPNQICYSLAMELLTSISRGVYPPGSLLPPMEQLAREKNISTSTVRRAVGLLCNIGAVKSSRPYGMRVLPIMDSAKNCDFTQPAIRQRLIDMLESLHILALSCRSVAELTLNSLDADSIRRWTQTLSALKESPHYSVLSYVVLDLIANDVPYITIRTVYSELLRQLFWGNPLRGMKGDLETTNAILEPYLTGLLACLEEGNIAGFCDKLWEMMRHELKDSVDYLIRAGVKEAGNLLVPEWDE